MRRALACSARRRRAISILLVIAAGVSAWVQLAGDAGTATRAPAPGGAQLQAWNGHEVPVPAGWRRVASEPGTASWQSEDHSGTLTVVVVPASSTALDEVVRAAADAMPDELPGVRVQDVSSQQRRATISFVLEQAGAPPIRGRQIWVRGRGEDVISTWTAAASAPLGAGAALPAHRG